MHSRFYVFDLIAGFGCISPLVIFLDAPVVDGCGNKKTEVWSLMLERCVSITFKVTFEGGIDSAFLFGFLRDGIGWRDATRNKSYRKEKYKTAPKQKTHKTDRGIEKEKPLTSRSLF
ncbi:MAG: hypothetical protein ABH950_01930 [Candidatus Altiarchaeota archaeon]